MQQADNPSPPASAEPDRPAEPIEPAARRWLRAAGAWLLGGSLLFVALVTLAPFNFRRPDDARVYFRPARSVHARDAVVNVLLFVPVGLGVAAMSRGRRGARLLLLCAGAGLAASLTVEVLQLFLPARRPTLTDLLYNAAGAAAGGAVLVAAGARVERAADAARRLVAVPRPLPGMALLVLLGLQFVLPIASRKPGRLNSWDERFPLLVGNEATGGRPWLGIVSEVHLLDRALDPTEVAHLSVAGGPLGTPLRRWVLASYETVGPAPYPDRARGLPPLADQPAPPPDQPAPPPGREGPARTSADHWLSTVSDVGAASRRIGKEGQFTLAATLAARTTPQANHRRVVSISSAADGRNLTLTQDGRDLYVHVRSKLTGWQGTRPAFRVRGVFATTEPQRVVISYDGAGLAAYVNGEPRGRFRFTPEAAVLWRLAPTRHWPFDLGDSMAPTSLLYRLALVLPPAWLLARVARRGAARPPVRLALAAGLVMGMGAANELLLAFLNGAGPRPLHHVATAVVCAAALAPAARDVMRGAARDMETGAARDVNRGGP